ncbi:DNA polymerase III subunit beta [Sinorhizobium meliloti]|uniref:DNA polymerase III subunit beta n=1 Tax=Rhizobium meliloti TaxID=382 RepID=UPI000FDA95AA|nr:DNA polymerase III subunit beta [Sinorhizobium meliloti]RVM08414.1 DNA polymerase III subunit beta [Sinorhizobium meliloti]RVO25346.1 DNA polymerase III subunit beta [Sinorhizobium meliloti]
MFKAEKAAMASALAITNSVVERRSTIPILQNVLFEKDSASSDKLIARFTNLDIEATVRFSAEVDSDFEAFTVPAGTLSDIVNKLPDGADVAILPDRTNGLTGVTLKAGRSRFKLPVLPADDFATMKVGELPYSLTLPATELGAALADVGFAVSTEETRYYLNGIFTHSVEDGVCLVATDGHRLSKRIIRTETEAAMPGVIIPRGAVKVISKILPKEGPVHLQVSDRVVRIAAGDTTLTSKLIDGTFPDYQRVIPTQHEMLATIDVQALSTSIDRVAAVSGERGQAVHFNFADQVLKLTVNNPDAGEAEDEVTFEGQADLSIGFNARYVADALAHLPGDRFEIGLGSPGDPAVLRSVVGSRENLIVLMPMRV